MDFNPCPRHDGGNELLSETAPGVGSPLVTAVVDMVMLYSPTRARPAGSASRTRTIRTLW